MVIGLEKSTNWIDEGQSLFLGNSHFFSCIFLRKKRVLECNLVGHNTL